MKKRSTCDLEPCIAVRKHRELWVIYSSYSLAEENEKETGRSRGQLEGRRVKGTWRLTEGRGRNGAAKWLKNIVVAIQILADT